MKVHMYNYFVYLFNQKDMDGFNNVMIVQIDIYIFYILLRLCLCITAPIIAMLPVFTTSTARGVVPDTQEVIVHSVCMLYCLNMIKFLLLSYKLPTANLTLVYFDNCIKNKSVCFRIARNLSLINLVVNSNYLCLKMSSCMEREKMKQQLEIKMINILWSFVVTPCVFI